MNRPVANDLLLDKQVAFKTHHGTDGQVTHGEFVVDRLYCAGFKDFPSCKTLAHETAQKLVRKLEKFGSRGENRIAKEVSYKVQVSFFKGRVKWAEEKDLKGKVTFIPQLVVLSRSLTSTSAARLCIIPNRQVWINSSVGMKSYNDYVRSSSLKMPPLSRLYLGASLSLGVLFLDFTDSFGSLKHSPETAKQSIVYCLKTKTGLPTYDFSESEDGVLHPLLQTSSSYGARDAPTLSQRAVSRMVEMYRNYCPAPEVDEGTLDQLQQIVTGSCYVDDSSLPAQPSRLLAWSEQHGSSQLSFPSCACKNPCHNWKCASLTLTSGDLEKYEEFVKNELPHFLTHLASSFIKVANFCSHRVKHIQAPTLEIQRVVDAARLIEDQTPPLPAMPGLVDRPSSTQLQEEIQRGLRRNLSLSEDPNLTTPDPSPFLENSAAQLGKVYQGSSVYLKTTQIYISFFQNRSKKKTPHFSNYQAARAWCTANKVKISKLTLSSFGGLLFDQQGRHLVLVRCFVKEATRLHLLGGPKSWEAEASERVTEIFWRAVEAFFLLCRRPHPRSNLYLHPAARYFLLCGSDASLHLQSVVCTLISYLYVDGTYKAKAMHLLLANYINHTDLNNQIPLAELLAAQKGVSAMLTVLKDLEDLGIVLPRENVIFTLDARTVLLQLRTRGIFYQKKIQSLILRIQCQLAEANLSAFENLAFISQKDLPNGARYHPDLISKSKMEKATAESILRDEKDLHDLRWIEETPPWDWTWVRRDYGVPALDDKTLVEELGVQPDFLDQLKEHLEKPTVIHHSAMVDSNPTSASSQCPSSSPTSASSQRPSSSPTSAPPQCPSSSSTTDSTTPHSAVNISWKQEIITLIQRKRAYQLGPKGVISILAKVILFCARLKSVLLLTDTERVFFKSNLRTAHLARCGNIVPWSSGDCHSVLCGIAKGVNCGKTHKLATPDPPPGSRHKKEAHSLFTPWSPTGHGLGIPLDKPVGTDRKFFHQLTAVNARVMAFDLLCCLFSAPSSAKGFTWTKERVLWGDCWVGRGRKQRDWTEMVDYTPIFRSIDPDSDFAQLCILAAHCASIGQSSELPGLFLTSLRIHISGATSLVKELKKQCFACNIAKARAKRQNTRIQQLNQSPSGQLIALSLFPQGFEVVVCDLTGAVKWELPGGLVQSLYFLVCVSSHWGEMRVIPIKSKKTEDLVLGLKTLALQKACKFNILYTDMGGEFAQCQNTYSPMKPLRQTEPKVKEWFSSLKTDAHQLEMAGLGVFVQFGAKRHASVAKVETKVGSLKRALRAFGSIGSDASASSIFEIHYLVAFTQYILDSRPLFIQDGKVYSFQTIKAMMMQGGTLENPQDGIEAVTKGSTKNKIESVCSRLATLRRFVTSAMMEHCLPSLLDTTHRRERFKSGLPATHLRQNDIIFDTINYMDTGCVSGNLARVASVGASSNHVLLSKALLNTPGDTFKQQIVSRPVEYCHFIAPGDHHGTLSFEEEERTFDITKYLPKTTLTLPGVYTLPPRATPTDVSSASSSAAPPPPSPTPSPAAAPPPPSPTPSPALSNAARIVSVSRSGRIIKKPQYYSN